MKKAEAVLGPLLKQLGIESGVKLQRIRNDWPSLIDPRISAHMFPASLNEKVLLLNVESPAWMQQLNYFRKEILQKLAGYEICDLRFRLGKIPAVPDNKKEKLPERTLSDDEKSFISSAVSDLGNEELRDVIRRTIEKAFISDRKKPSHQE